MSSVASMLMPGTKPLQSPEVSPSISLSVSAPGMSKEHMKQRYQRTWVCSVHERWEWSCHLGIQLDGHLAILLPQALYLLLVAHRVHLRLSCSSLELHQAGCCGRELLYSLTLSPPAQVQLHHECCLLGLSARPLWALSTPHWAFRFWAA